MVRSAACLFYAGLTMQAGRTPRCWPVPPGARTPNLPGKLSLPRPEPMQELGVAIGLQAYRPRLKPDPSPLARQMLDQDPQGLG